MIRNQGGKKAVAGTNTVKRQNFSWVKSAAWRKYELNGRKGGKEREFREGTRRKGKREGYKKSSARVRKPKQSVCNVCSSWIKIRRKVRKIDKQQKEVREECKMVKRRRKLLRYCHKRTDSRGLLLFEIKEGWGRRWAGQDGHKRQERGSSPNISQKKCRTKKRPANSELGSQEYKECEKKWAAVEPMGGWGGGGQGVVGRFGGGGGLGALRGVGGVGGGGGGCGAETIQILPSGKEKKNSFRNIEGKQKGVARESRIAQPARARSKRGGEGQHGAERGVWKRPKLEVEVVGD